jgi:hypothetical protein
MYNEIDSMRNSYRAIVEKWDPFLTHKELPKISDLHKKEVTAVLLENQLKHNYHEIKKYGINSSLTATLGAELLSEAAPTNSMGASSGVASTGHIDLYDPIMMNMVRRSFPNLMAYDVCGVQPMTMPTGQIFALRSRYGAQDGIEALFNEAQTPWTAAAAANTQVGTDPSVLITGGEYTYSKGVSTATLEAMGGDANNMIPEMSLSIEKLGVTAEGRAISATYSHELASDLKNVHNMDAEAELANILAKQILADINRQVIRSIYTTSTFGAQGGVTNNGTFDLDVDANGRWSVEKWKGLIFQVEREANAIAKATRMGKGNFIITSSDVASALALSGQLDYQSAMSNEKLSVDDTGNTFAGTMFGRLKVYVDPYFQTQAGAQYVTVGYKGTSQFDAGIFYCPYIPLQMYRAVGENSFQPRIAFKTRYGMVAHPFATDAADGAIAANKKNKYYRTFRVLNLL